MMIPRHRAESMVVANEGHGKNSTEGRSVGALTHVGCSFVAVVLTVGVLLVVGVGTLFAVLDTLGYLSTTVFVWLVLVSWVAWWLAAEIVVGRVRGADPAQSR